MPQSQPSLQGETTHVTSYAVDFGTDDDSHEPAPSDSSQAVACHIICRCEHASQATHHSNTVGQVTAGCKHNTLACPQQCASMAHNLVGQFAATASFQRLHFAAALGRYWPRESLCILAISSSGRQPNGSCVSAREPTSLQGTKVLTS